LRAALDNPNQLERQGEIQFFAHAISVRENARRAHRDEAKSHRRSPSGKSGETFAKIPRLRQRRPSVMFAAIDNLYA
jgi:hypothetical protein